LEAKPLIYQAETGLWQCNNSNFIKNEFDPFCPCFIEINQKTWKASWKGQFVFIDWSDFSLPLNILDSIELVTKSKLKSGKVAVTHLREINNLLSKLTRIWPKRIKDFSQLEINDFNDIWESLDVHSRSTFRQLIVEIAKSSQKSLNSFSCIIKNWHARTKVKTLRRVLNWDPEFGALTSTELELFKDKLRNKVPFSSQHCSARLLSMVMLEIMKRPQQLLSMKSNALIIVESNNIREYFLVVPKSKYQSGEPSERWSISRELADEINAFSKIPSIASLQNKFDRLLLWDNKGLHLHGQMSSQWALSAIKKYVTSLNITSPRTNRLLHVTPYRLRHTVATRMSFQGVARDVIQNILEHTDSSSAQAYIDTVGSYIVPEMERVERNMGNIFQQLNDIFFKGKISSDLKKSQIFIPIFEANPMPVGSCGKDPLIHGQCKKNPFIACYNGCKDFIAWKDANHSAALMYVENELQRWNASEGIKDRSKSIQNFENVHQAILEVIQKVETFKI